MTMPYRKALNIHCGNQPFEVALLVTCVLTGVTGLLTGNAAPVLQQVLGDHVWVWHAGLVVGSAVTLVAVFLRLPMTLVVERVGMIWLATLFLAYGAAILLLSTATVATAGGITLGFGLASIARVVQITNDLGRLRVALAQEPTPTTVVIAEPDPDKGVL
jgi:hypothetical protein